MATSLNLSDGTRVMSADGADVGKIERLVIDPARKRVSHLVVSKGRFSPEERLLPLALVASLVDEVVVLGTPADATELSLFEETRYLTPGDRRHDHPVPMMTDTSLAWGYPALGVMSRGRMFSSSRSAPQPIPDVIRNVPSGSVVVEIGAPVLGSDGERLGVIAGAAVADDGALVSVDVDPGWFQDLRTVPATVIEELDDDSVSLDVGADAFVARGTRRAA